MVEPVLGRIPGYYPDQKALKFQEQTNGVSDSDGVILAEAIHSGAIRPLLKSICSPQMSNEKKHGLKKGGVKSYPVMWGLLHTPLRGESPLNIHCSVTEV